MSRKFQHQTFPSHMSLVRSFISFPPTSNFFCFTVTSVDFHFICFLSFLAPRTRIHALSAHCRHFMQIRSDQIRNERARERANDAAIIILANSSSICCCIVLHCTTIKCHALSLSLFEFPWGLPSTPLRLSSCLLSSPYRKHQRTGEQTRSPTLNS